MSVYKTKLTIWNKNEFGASVPSSPARSTKNKMGNKSKTINTIILVAFVLALSYFVSKSSFIKVVSIEQPPYAQSKALYEK